MPSGRRAALTARISRIAPGLPALLRYARADLRHAVVAGLSVAAVAPPVGVAYAELAGVPPVVGLYASIPPLVAYALFGTSRQLVLGQAGKIIGFPASTEGIIPRAIDILGKLSSTHLPTFAVGAATFLVLVVAPRVLPAFPGQASTARTERNHSHETGPRRKNEYCLCRDATVVRTVTGGRARGEREPCRSPRHC